MLIDCHTHVFPEEVRRQRERYAARSSWFAQLYPPKARVATVEDLVAEMEANGVDKAVALSFCWADPGLCAAANDYLLEAWRRYPNRLLPFAMVQPLAGERAALEIERCARLGMRGVGELNADGQGFALQDPKVMGPIVEAASAYGLPILIHTSEPLGHDYPGKGSATPEVVLRFLQNFPQAKVICAHWGGGLPFYELMPEVKKAAANVYYDTAATPLLYRAAIFPAATHLVGTEKILFGSDFPLVRQKRLLEMVRGSSLSPQAQADVLGGNAARLLGLGAEAAAEAGQGSPEGCQTC